MTAPLEYRNWVCLDAKGRDLWVVYAHSRETAIKAHPFAIDARPAELTPHDLELCRLAAESFGSLD